MVITLCAFIGSFVLGTLVSLLAGGVLNFAGVVASVIGGILGIWFGYQISR